jgi:hypothetical protein
LGLKNVVLKNKHLTRLARLAPVAAILLVFGQQCARTPLTAINDFSYSSLNGDKLLPVPQDMTSIQRYIIAVDMSWSMVSGPCPQDISEIDNYDPTYGTPAFRTVRESYDPNIAGGKYYPELAAGATNGRTFPFKRDDGSIASPGPVVAQNFYDTNVRPTGPSGYPAKIKIGSTTSTLSHPNFSNNEFDHLNSGMDCVVQDPNSVPQDYKLFRQNSPKRYGGITPFTDFYGSPSFPFFNYDNGLFFDALWSNTLTLYGKNPVISNRYRTYRGLDWEGKRLDMLYQLMEQLKNDTTASRTLVMLVPISGGVAQSKLLSMIGGLRWMKPEIVQQLIKNDIPGPGGDPNDLFEAQEIAKQGAANASNEWNYERRWLGTTAPNDVLMGETKDSGTSWTTEYGHTDLDDGLSINKKPVLQLLIEEMQSLARDKTLDRTTINVLMVTDGRVTPTVSDINKAKAALGCPATGTCVYDTLLRQFWGRADINKRSDLKSMIQKFLELPAARFDNQGKVLFNIVDLNSYANGTNLFPVEWSVDDEKAPFFSGLQMPGLRFYSALSNGQTNFPIGSVSTDPTIYEVSHVYALNLHVRARADGTTCIDSDADGLCDEDEIRLGLDPTDPRSFKNAAGKGVCLDSIFVRYESSCRALAAQDLCNPDIDADSDGLNACEESLLGTSPFDFDTDDDGIPDYLAWIYGYSLTDSKPDQDSNGDGISDIMNFKAGLGPNMLYSQIPTALKSNFTSNSVRYNINGRWMNTREVHITSLPTSPLLPVGAAGAASFAAKNGETPAITLPWAETVPTYSTTGQDNPYIVLARVVDTTNPDKVFWYIYKNSIDLRTRQLPDVIPLSQFRQIRFAADPQKVK